MHHEWWMRRRVDETEDEFERMRPVTEPDVTV